MPTSPHARPSRTSAALSLDPTRRRTSQRRGRRAWIATSLVAVTAAFGSTGAFAAGGTTGAVGASGTTYAMTVTCATRSATVRASLATASSFSSFRLSDQDGNVAFGDFTDGGQPSSTGPQDWVFSTYLDSDGDTYQLDEVSVSGAGSAVIAPVTTTDCPVYSGVGAQFVPVPPTRLLDTRPDSQVGYTGAKPVAGSSLDLQVTGRATIPANAVAVALNVTMTEATQPGFVQAFPTGIGTPGSSSNINAEAAGATIPNAVIVPIGNGGRVTLFSNGGTHVLADVSGYFVTAPAAVSAGRYTAIAPTRVLDTRAGSQRNYSGPTPGANATVGFNPVTAAGLPAGQVAAVAVNITATESTALGFVQVAPAGALVPGASSTLNIGRSGQTIPNMAIVPVSASGEIELYTQNGTNLIVDVLGWFTNATAPASTSGLYVPVVPERVLDTRPDSAVNFEAERRPVLGETLKPQAGDVVDVFFDGLPSAGVGAVILNLTATETRAAGFVQGAASGALVAGASSNINVERSGQTIANAAILPVSAALGVSLYTQNGTNLLADIGGFFRT